MTLRLRTSATACAGSTIWTSGIGLSRGWYWARFSAGLVLIREVSMRLVKKEAERRAQL
jgi:hypothetical protein